MSFHGPDRGAWRAPRKAVSAVSALTRKQWQSLQVPHRAAAAEAHRRRCTVQDMMHEVRAEPLDHWTRSAGIETGEVCQRTSHSPRLRVWWGGGGGGGGVGGSAGQPPGSVEGGQWVPQHTLPQNDPHDALISLNIHKWGKQNFQKKFANQLRLPSAKVRPGGQVRSQKVFCVFQTFLNSPQNSEYFEYRHIA